MTLILSRVQHVLVLVLLVIVIASVFLWVWHIVGMHEDGIMQSCLLAGGRVMLCTLSAAGHIGLWQEMSAAVLPVVAVVGILILVFSRQRSSFIQHLPSDQSASWQWFGRVSRAWISLDPLKQAFSQGVLHPKLYNLA